METNPGKTASLRCRQCGYNAETPATARRRLGTVYQVVVACAACRLPFVALSRN